MPIVVSSTPNSDPTAWIAPNCPTPTKLASRRIAMRVTLGAISFSNSTHFALMPNSNSAKAVALPPGAAKLAANPAPTGSMTLMKTIGNVRVASWSAGTARLVLATRTSGASWTNSLAP